MMPGGPDGIATLEQLKRRAPDLPVVMMSGKASLTDAVRATKLGAFQFLEKPLTPEGVLVALRAALELSRTRAENQRLHEALGHSDPLIGPQPGADRGARADRADRAHRSTGADHRRVRHRQGAGRLRDPPARAPAPRGRSCASNSAAIPKDLVESEMFGHERGAFTGAGERRHGRFELADGGTLFLDEVGDLGPEAQAKLLRVLETGVIERLGGERPTTVDVRVIAATNKGLAKAAQQGQFREDLLFRLDVLPIHIPPLRERTDDIAPLAHHFAARQQARLRRPVRFDGGAIPLLTGYGWPGNVRELANIVERLAILAGSDVISADDVARVLPNSAGAVASGEGAWTDVVAVGRARPLRAHADRARPVGRAGQRRRRGPQARDRPREPLPPDAPPRARAAAYRARMTPSSQDRLMRSIFLAALTLARPGAGRRAADRAGHRHRHPSRQHHRGLRPARDPAGGREGGRAVLQRRHHDAAGGPHAPAPPQRVARRRRRPQRVGRSGGTHQGAACWSSTATRRSTRPRR